MDGKGKREWERRGKREGRGSEGMGKGREGQGKGKEGMGMEP